ncbi:hypothetical protein TNCV_2888011 [Trichonephila clavipes]|nr:hypothetical protein TNCV_2888011 [Trichonephila clavipes]
MITFDDLPKVSQKWSHDIDAKHSGSLNLDLNQCTVRSSSEKRHLFCYSYSKILYCHGGSINAAPVLSSEAYLGTSLQTDHLTGTSAHAPQGPRSRILCWVQ